MANDNSTGEITIADLSEWEKRSMEDVPKYIEEHGVSGIEDFLKQNSNYGKTLKYISA